MKKYINIYNEYKLAWYIHRILSGEPVLIYKNVMLGKMIELFWEVFNSLLE